MADNVERPTWQRVVLAIGLVVVHAVVSVVLVSVVVSAAYALARSTPGAGEVSSVDQLYKVGTSPATAFYALALVGLFEFLATLVALAIPITRRLAWVVPLIGIGVSVVVVIAAVLTMHPPAPDIGG